MTGAQVSPLGGSRSLWREPAARASLLVLDRDDELGAVVLLVDVDRLAVALLDRERLAAARAAVQVHELALALAGDDLGVVVVALDRAPLLALRRGGAVEQSWCAGVGCRLGAGGDGSLGWPSATRA